MENRQRNNNNNRKRNHSRNNNQNSRPQRRRRVSVDRDVEVVVVSNALGRFFYENPRMSMVLDMEKIGSEEYVTVGDLRTILNSNRKILEGFDLLITEVLDSEYTVEDVLLFLGLDKKYKEYFSLTRKKGQDIPEVGDIKDFLTKAPQHVFESQMENMDAKLRRKVIETAVTLFKLKQFGDYNKMQVIQGYVNDELFDDAKETEVDEDVYI